MSIEFPVPQVNWPDFKQHWTLQAPCEFQGVGLHSGRVVSLAVKPRQIPGLVLYQGQDCWPVSHPYIRESYLNTRVGDVQTVEHLLAALQGVGVSAAEIHVQGPEIPALDGSAWPFAKCFLDVGLCGLSPLRPVFVLTQALSFELDEARIECVPAQGLRIDYQIDFAAVDLQQSYSFDYSPAAFCREIAPARTFALGQDIEALQAAGYAQGGSLDNALVLETTGYRNAARFADEPVRHKILDCLGDLALLGQHLQAHVKVFRGGHRSHAKLVEILAAQIGAPTHVRSP